MTGNPPPNALKHDNDEPFTGKIFDLDKSTGKKTLQGQYRNGLKTGKWTFYNEDGSIKEVKEYDKKLHGKKIQYNIN